MNLERGDLLEDALSFASGLFWSGCRYVRRSVKKDGPAKVIFCIDWRIFLRGLLHAACKLLHILTSQSQFPEALCRLVPQFWCHSLSGWVMTMIRMVGQLSPSYTHDYFILYTSDFHHFCWFWTHLALLWGWKNTILAGLSDQDGSRQLNLMSRHPWTSLQLDPDAKIGGRFFVFFWVECTEHLWYIYI